MEEEETGLLSASNLTQGYIATCKALGDQPELAETTLSVVGDERWGTSGLVAFQHNVHKRARLVQRNSASGQRGAEEYGKPLYGPEKLSAPGVPDLVHTKGDGAQFMQLLASQQPLKQLEKMIPHGFRQSKLFEALIQHEVPLPRALWLVKIIYLNRAKQSSSDRLKLWTEDVCQYIGELLKEGLYTRSFVSRGGEFHAAAAGGRQTASVGGRSRAPAPAAPAVEPEDERQTLETVREKWSYIVALARWSISANILDQELFLTSVVDSVEKAATSFGDRRVSAVIGMLVPILALLVPFATTLHRLTCRLATVCTSILQPKPGGPFAAAAAAAASTGTFLEDTSTAAVFDILHGLMRASPDAFVVSKVELPSLDELGNTYPGVEISNSFASSVKHIKARIDSLKRIETPSAISQRVLDIVLVLDRMMGAAQPDALIEKFVDPRTCPAFSREKSSADREDSLRALVHIVCNWATTGSSESAFPSSRRRTVACKTLKKFQLVHMQRESESVAVAGRDRPAGATSRKTTRDVVEASIYSWVSSIHSRDTGYNPWAFIRRSELIAALFEENVTSLEGLTSQLIVDGAMEGAQLEVARYLIVFYGALVLRFMPSQDSCRANASLKNIRGTCTALLDSARSVLGRISGESSDETLLRAPPGEKEMNAEVDALVKSSLAALSAGEEFSDQQRLFASCSSVHPYVRWQFASRLAREAVKSVESTTLLPAIGMLQAAGYLAPLLDFLVNVFSAHTARGICAEVVLSHMLSYETNLISRGAPESLVAAIKQRADPSWASTANSAQGAEGDAEKMTAQHRKMISEGLPVVADDAHQVPSKDAESKAKAVGKALAEACCDSAQSAGCAARAAMVRFSERVESGQAGQVDEHLQVTLFAELISQLAVRSRDSVHAVALSVIKFCDEYYAAASLSDSTMEDDDARAVSIPSVLLRLVAEGLIPLRQVVQVLVPVETNVVEATSAATRAFWMLHLIGPAEKSKPWVALSLSAAQSTISPAVVLDMIVTVAASASTGDVGQNALLSVWNQSPSPSTIVYIFYFSILQALYVRAFAPCVKSLCSHEPIRTAVLLAAAGGDIGQSLLHLVKTCCSKHKITNVQSERIAHVILKVRDHLINPTRAHVVYLNKILSRSQGMNDSGMPVNEESSLDRRALDVLSSLTVGNLSLQAAELKFVYALMGTVRALLWVIFAHPLLNNIFPRSAGG
jgi:hypothetical protein